MLSYFDAMPRSFAALARIALLVDRLGELRRPAWVGNLGSRLMCFKPILEYDVRETSAGIFGRQIVKQLRILSF
jgi:hypothetical protein